MTPSQHAAAVVAVAQAHEAVEHLGLEIVVTVQPWKDTCELDMRGLVSWSEHIPGILATVETIGAVGFFVLAVFVPEMEP